MQPNTTLKVIKGQTNLNNNGNVLKGIRVAAYCRVSTDGEEQLNSFSSQVKYYTDKIKANPEWIFSGIYSDEAITGTKVSVREGFQKMVSDCMEGKIDMIITKSISRFARNTVDTLNYVRKLKDKRVAVFFEEENINTLTMDGELLLTILSSVAQQEVQNISEHVKKGLKMKLQQGSIVGFPPCYGFDYDPIHKKISINVEEAKIVKYIFERYASGVGGDVIAKELREMKCLTKRGNCIWNGNTVRAIIKNVKYKGDLLFGKTYTADPIYKKRVVNKGEQDQYYIENHHEAIVSRELWDRTNELLVRKKCDKQLSLHGDYSDFTGKYALSKKIKCGFCGGPYTRRAHMQTSTTKKPVWRCKVSTSQGIKYCQDSKALDDVALKKAFTEALEMLVQIDSNLLDSFMNTLSENILSSNPTSKIESLKTELMHINIRKNKAIDLMLDGALTREEYDKRSFEYNEKINSIEEEISLLEELEAKQGTIQEKLNVFKEKISLNLSIDEFDKDICDAILDKIVVGGYDEEGNKNPYLVTIVFDINCSNEISSNKKNFEIGSFNCKYKFTSFEINELGFRTKKNIEEFPVKIAIKIQ